MNQLWRTSDGITVSFNDMLATIKSHVTTNGLIYIGTDSFISKSKCTFASAICLHGADKQSGGKYFFRKVSFKREKFGGLVHRITQEVQQSIEIALMVTDNVPHAEVELHLDISPANKQHGTSQFADMLTGFAKGSGFNFKIKPNAWASQSVADKHSK
jgi:predicted RNase H-related nuclease YkuK (DUF458 family)